MTSTKGPTCLQLNIIQRFLSAKEVQDFLKKYNGAKMK